MTTKHLEPNLRTDRVLKQSEKYAVEIEKILNDSTKALTQYTDVDALGNKANITDFDQILIDRKALLKALTNLMMQETYKCYAADTKLGIACGRMEVMAMILSADSLDALQAFAKKSLKETR
jgi:hypothetical protein